jgi:hypothetical protein
MNNIQELVIDKIKALSVNQQKSVLHFIDLLLSPNVIESDEQLEKLLIEGIDSLERGEGIEAHEVFDPSPEQIAASLHVALHEVKTGQTKPISQLFVKKDN